jgi:hypothetical protein
VRLLRAVRFGGLRPFVLAADAAMASRQTLYSSNGYVVAHVFHSELWPASVARRSVTSG